jgi:hypothetical protein
MDEKIFDIVNRMKIDLNQYEEITLTDLQNKQNIKRILNKLNVKKDNVKMKWWKTRKKIAVACMVAVLATVSATMVAFASEGKIFNYLYKFFNGSSITTEYNKVTGEGKSSIDMNATEKPPVELADGKLYFIANGSRTDITSLISNSTPYISECVDEQNITHKFIIGGNPTEESYGYEENLFDRNGKFLGASGYFGKNVELDDDAKPEWLQKGRSEIGRTVY